MSAAGGSSRLHSLHFIPQLFPFFRSLQLQRRQLLSRGSKCAPAPFRPHRQETKARDSPRTPELDAVGEAPALPSALPRPTAPGMPWGAPSCCLTLRGHHPPDPMAPSPGLPWPWPRPRSPGGAGRRRRREGQGGRERWGRAVGWLEKGGRWTEG